LLILTTLPLNDGNGDDSSSGESEVKAQHQQEQHDNTWRTRTKLPTGKLGALLRNKNPTVTSFLYEM
jgi:hypothetical protein